MRYVIAIDPVLVPNKNIFFYFTVVIIIISIIFLNCKLAGCTCVSLSVRVQKLFALTPYMSHQPSFTQQMRAVLVDWLVEVCTQFSPHPLCQSQTIGREAM
jgi:hypothetical protein